ncbi:conserved hypothetical protein [Staphylococcus aureus]|uniref:Uncharacterized protein n=1 Tax=Staphylococcus aureus TaxID=1280 RepID=A0A0U1MER5_STAAU|nr:conserved hypothetical protein [Staphylococcus aureus]
MLIIKNNQNEFLCKNKTKFYKMLLKFKLEFWGALNILKKAHDNICRGNK